jgi:hypothetical protein
LKLEAEQDLRPEDQEPRFIKRCFQLSFDHAGLPAKRTFWPFMSSCRGAHVCVQLEKGRPRDIG